MFVKILLALTLLALLVGFAARPSGGAGRPRVYVVRPADTLWSIAVAHYAGDPREGVWKLEHRNNLASPALVPGQALVLP
jgi:LysM repeat protein